jgi:Relaxase/Mobilisation nuclease domain
MMFARILSLSGARKALAYNKKKVKEGKAEWLLAENFIKDRDQLSAEDILYRFGQLTSLNERVEKNMFHIPIGFGVDEKISNEKMSLLAKRFMEGMRLDDHPYVCYRHHDTPHTHMHIITTRIGPDGERLPMSPGDMRALHRLTKQLEKEFSLVPYRAAIPSEQNKLKAGNAQWVKYGEVPLKRAISDVLDTVIDRYKYTSLPELNAILRLYNVRADRGSESSNIYRNRGLVYQALDENGQPRGRSINASDFLLKPTLSRLEEKFEANRSLREEHRPYVCCTIDMVLFSNPPDWQHFPDSLIPEMIGVVVQKGKDKAEHLFFVDFNTKTVFKGEDLGEKYSLPSIRQRCAGEEEYRQRQHQKEAQKLHHRLRR